ncbi:MAG: FtsW/RodA/SpoVE family cell cycle protein [Candidatus Beckwithbacteria bacterium]|nr:FtsW/RodA/SpoVE family cell cycle protein [Candidatus Beckwithbacteria bacterium]
MPFLIPVLIILIFSFLSLISISLALGLDQLLFIAVGLLAFFVFSRLPYSLHRYVVKIYSVFVVIFLLLPFLFGTLTRGAIRWIQIGPLTLQPSEIIKPFLIIIFSAFMANRPRILTYSLVLIIPAVLIFKQPDLGSALVIVAVWLGILLASKISFKTLTIFSLAVLLVSPLAWRGLKAYQQQRIASFLNPYADPKVSGYHLIQSVISVGSGGFFGRGLGHGPQSQLKFLPERQTDFIFASLSEELGFAGSLTLILAYFFLLKWLLAVTLKASDEFGRLISAGVFSLIFFQFTVNVGMNLGLLPITGITLPLVSSGGSSILAISICFGLVYNISKSSPPQKSLEIK